MTSVKYEKDSNNIAHIILDKENSTANLMDVAFAEDFAQATAKLATDSFDGVIIRSTKPTFFAGGDINMLFNTTKNDTQFVFDLCTLLKSSMRKIETCGKPVVACIAGAAMGGGWEIALCAHHRIALSNKDNTKSIKLGLPEVTLGLLPGAGGVTRMVRLLGIQSAMPYLVKGKSFTPEQGIENGLIHSLAGNEVELLDSAIYWIKSNTRMVEPPSGLVSGINIQPWDVKGYKIPQGAPKDKNIAMTLPITPALIRRETQGTLPAPELIYATMVEGAQVDFDSACRIESRYFTELTVGQISKNIINTFWFNLKEVKTGDNKLTGVKKTKFSRIGVLGASTMAKQIASYCAIKGISVTITDDSLEKAEHAKKNSVSILEKQIAFRNSTVEDAQKTLDLIKASNSHNDLIDCQFVINTVGESQTKQKLMQERKGTFNTDDIYSANPSFLLMTESLLGNIEVNSSINMNFLPSIHNMQVVEIICSENATHTSIARCHDFILQLNKIPVIVNASHTSYTSRLTSVFVKEGVALLQDTCSASIENAAYLSGFPLAPLALCDEISLVSLKNLGTQNYQCSEGEVNKLSNHPADSIINDMIKNKRFGKNSEAGFYNYVEDSKHDTKASLYSEVTKYNTENNEISLDDIKERLLFIMAIEAVRCLDERVINSTAEANVGGVYGIGFPQWTGGPLQFINQYGLQKFITRADELKDCYGERFHPPALLNEMLNENKPF